MITIRFSGRVPEPREIDVGMETDMNVEQLRFLLPQITDMQRGVLYMLLPDGASDLLEITDGMVTLGQNELLVSGQIRAWVELYAGGTQPGTATALWHSETFYMKVRDLPPASEILERQYPTALQEALDAGHRLEQYQDAGKAAAEIVIAQCSLIHVDVDEEDHELVIEQKHFTDSGAYAIAVKNGYQGTETEWNHLIYDMTHNKSAEDAQTAADAAQEAAEAAEELAQQALDAADEGMTKETETITILTTDWDSQDPPQAEVECEIAVADQAVDFDVTIGLPLTAEQYAAFRDAEILCTDQDDGSLTFTCFGAVPGEDLPIFVRKLAGGEPAEEEEGET